MSKLDLSTQILDADDGPLMDPPVGDKPPLKITLRIALLRALAADHDVDNSVLSAEKKLERYELWRKIKRSKPDVLDMNPEELVLLRHTVMGFPTLIAGQVRGLLI